MNPPPPPPHGEVPKGSGLPPGKYDIFVIPQHSSGSGFLYLPSLKPNVNSFAAGFATALILVALFSAVTPALQAWWYSVRNTGGMGMIMVMVAIGVGAWALGRTQNDGPGPGGGNGSNGGRYGGPYTNGTNSNHSNHSNPQPNAYSDAGPGPTPNSGPSSGPSPRSAPEPGHGPPPRQAPESAPPPRPAPEPAPRPPPRQAPDPAPRPPPRQAPEPAPGPPPRQAPEPVPPPRPAPEPAPGPPPKEPPKSSWQRPPPTTGAGASASQSAKGQWEKAREETRKKEEQRKAAEVERKRKEDLEKRLKEAREKDARERAVREQAARDKAKKEAEKVAEKEKVEQKLAEKLAESKPKGSTYAFSAMGEKTNPWPRGHPPAAKSQPVSPTKKPPPPTARTYLGNEDDEYSYRPYDKPRHSKAPSSVYSESSYAASQSTSRTTPPPSRRGPYSTKDPDKIVVKAVYAFTNAFVKTPTQQLVSGTGSVTDGLILRITTEGLFIDDDVRGVPQREWDVKAWTMKLVETGELQSRGLHVLRASIRDQEGKRYLFIITEEESWKVAIGLQRLRKGTQVRALGVSSMSANDARSTLENLGWA